MWQVKRDLTVSSEIDRQAADANKSHSARQIDALQSQLNDLRSQQRKEEDEGGLSSDSTAVLKAQIDDLRSELALKTAKLAAYENSNLEDNDKPSGTESQTGHADEMAGGPTLSRYYAESTPTRSQSAPLLDEYEPLRRDIKPKTNNDDQEKDSDANRKSRRSKSRSTSTSPSRVPQSVHAKKTLSLLSSIKKMQPESTPLLSKLKGSSDVARNLMLETPKIQKPRSSLLEEESFTATVKGTDKKIVFDDDSELFDENGPVSGVAATNGLPTASAAAEADGNDNKKQAKKSRKRKLKATVVAIDLDEDDDHIGEPTVHPSQTQQTRRFASLSDNRNQNQTRTSKTQQPFVMTKKRKEISPLKAENEKLRGVFKFNI